MICGALVCAPAKPAFAALPMNCDESLPSRTAPWPCSRVTLAVLAVATLLLVAIACSPLRSGFADVPPRSASDVALYDAEARRIAAGEGYYQVLGSELRTRGYPTRSVFNWRAPLPVWLIGALPERGIARGLLGAAAVALLLWGFSWLATEGSVGQGLLGGVLLSGALLPLALGELFVMPEVWSGVFLGLSLAAYGTGRARAGLAAGLAALFLRELAAVYCLVCLLLAGKERRWRELAAWLAGLLAYAIYYGLHVRAVLPLIRPDDLAHSHGWVRFGGAAFVLSTVQMNVYLLLLPQWVTALYLGAALVGFASWNTAAGRRIGLTAAAYLVAFGVVGQDFNQYWGSLLAPLFSLGAARGIGLLLAATGARLPRRRAVATG